MADYNLGTARGTIEIGYKGDGPKQAQTDLDGMRKNSGNTAAALGTVGRGALIAGAAVAAGIGVAVNSAANFEQRMSAVAAVSGASGKEFDALRNKALQLGKDTQFSATEAAQAIEELTKAGLGVGDVLGGAADATVALAAAGELDMAQAATIAANAKNQFDIAAKDLPHVADVLAGAANASAISVQDLGDSLNYVGPVAKAVGVSLDDTATALAILGNAGIKGSAGGTALRSILSNLVPTTKKATAQFKELGLITAQGKNLFVDAHGAIKPLDQVVQILNDHTKGLSKTEKNTFAKKSFGLETLSSVSILAGQTTKSFDAMADSIGKVTAADVAKKKMDNLKGSLEQLKGSLETAAIQLGTALIPAIRGIADGLNVIVGAFSSLPAPVQQAIGIFLVAAASILLMVGALIKIVQFVTAAKAAFTTLKEISVVAKVLTKLRTAFTVVTGAIRAFTLALLTNPVFLIIAAIVALVAILVILYKKNETVRAVIDSVWSAIKSAVSSVVDWLVGTAWPAIQSVWDGIVSGVTALGAFWAGVWSSFIGIISSVWNSIVSVISTVVSVIVAVVMAYINTLVSFWTGVWNFFAPVVSAVFALIYQIVRIAVLLVVITVLTIIKVLVAAWNLVWNSLVAVVTTVWGVIKTVVTAAIGFVVSIITLYLNIIKAIWSAIWGFLGPIVAAVWGAIKKIVSKGISTVVGAVGPPLKKIISVVSGVWDTVTSVFSSAWEAIKGAVSTGIGTVVKLVTGLKTKVLKPFADLATRFYNAGKKLMTMIRDGIVDGIQAAVSAAKKAADKLAEFVPGSPVRTGPLKVLNNGYAGGRIVKMIAEGIDKHADALQASMDAATRLDLSPTTKGLTQSAIEIATAQNNSDATRFAIQSSAEKTAAATVLKLVGTLDLTDASTAVIKGAAQEVVDSDKTFEQTVDKMKGAA